MSTCPQCKQYPQDCECDPRPTGVPTRTLSHFCENLPLAAACLIVALMQRSDLKERAFTKAEMEAAADVVDTLGAICEFRVAEGKEEFVEMITVRLLT